MPEITDKRIDELLLICRASDKFNVEKAHNFYRDVEILLLEAQKLRAK